MILILSFSYFEQGTDPVVDWLLYYNVPFIRVCVEDLLTRSHECYLDINSGRLLINGNDVTEQVKVIFLRRFYRHLPFEPKEVLGDISRKIFYESNYELESLTSFLFTVFKSKIWFPEPSVANVNKLEITFIASRLGIPTPQSAIINNKKQLKDFFNSCNGNVINKPINRLSYYTFGKYTYSTYTTKFTDQKIDSLPDTFFPSLFQEAVQGQYEVRVFFIDGEFYSVAAVSSNKNRNIDIKRSFNTRELHWVPYELPIVIKTNICRLMNEINLITGSIDLIVNEKNEYIFIEVNPVGQYLAPSHQGNYYLEKIIAEWLVKKLSQL
jgi:hypothetical protein